MEPESNLSATPDVVSQIGQPDDLISQSHPVWIWQLALALEKGNWAKTGMVLGI